MRMGGLERLLVGYKEDLTSFQHLEDITLGCLNGRKNKWLTPCRNLSLCHVDNRLFLLVTVIIVAASSIYIVTLIVSLPKPASLKVLAKKICSVHQSSLPLWSHNVGAQLNHYDPNPLPSMSSCVALIWPRLSQLRPIKLECNP
ncbi:hypothetical protein Ancab_013231 [Ancistrocladus abbreviatus]